jgi:hypothetical protein
LEIKLYKIMLFPFFPGKSFSQISPRLHCSTSC